MKNSWTSDFISGFRKTQYPRGTFQDPSCTETKICTQGPQSALRIPGSTTSAPPAVGSLKPWILNLLSQSLNLNMQLLNLWTPEGWLYRTMQLLITWFLGSEVCFHDISIPKSIRQKWTPSGKVSGWGGQDSRWTLPAKMPALSHVASTWPVGGGVWILVFNGLEFDFQLCLCGLG